MDKRAILIIGWLLLGACSQTQPSFLVGEWEKIGPGSSETLIFFENGEFELCKPDSVGAGQWELNDDVDPIQLHLSLSEYDDDMASLISTIEFMDSDRFRIIETTFFAVSGEQISFDSEEEYGLIFVRQ